MQIFLMHCDLHVAKHDFSFFSKVKPTMGLDLCVFGAYAHCALAPKPNVSYFTESALQD